MTTTMPGMTPEAALKRYWGYDGFRPLQSEIIQSLLDGHDTIGLLPTGGGKSLTFQVPALVMDGVTLVVTPLVSLMKDQADNLSQRGIKSVYFHSGLTRSELDYAMAKCRLGKVKIVYVSPEKLALKGFREEARQWRLSALVVDEAHCISQWGYDFRPSYLNIGLMRELVPGLPVLALTASATKEVVADISDRLGMRAPRIFSKSFERSNISYVVRYVEHKEDKLIEALRHINGPGIVYTRSRRRTKELAALLTDAGIKADYYHAGLSPRDKSQKQDRWKSGETDIIVATNAFGMGIDKADVRIVAHYDLPSSLEEYYQESGRAGRDGLPAYSLVLVAKKDKAYLRRSVAESYPDKEYIYRIYQLACVFLNVSVGAGGDRLLEFPLEKFCSTFSLKESMVVNALGLLTRAGWLEFISEPRYRSRVMVLADKSEFYSFRLDRFTEDVFQAMLRLYTGVFSEYAYIDEEKIRNAVGPSTASSEQIYRALLALAKHGIIHYIPKRATPSIYFPIDRVDTSRIYLPQEVYETQKKRMSRRVESMVSFAYAETTCRRNILLEYFGETPDGECGQCDVCRAKRRDKPSVETMARMERWIMTLLDGGPATLTQIKALVPGWQSLAEATVRRLASEGRLRIEGLKVYSVRYDAD